MDLSWATAPTNAFVGGYDAGQAIGDAYQGNWAGAGENAFAATAHIGAAFGEGAVGDDV